MKVYQLMEQVNELKEQNRLREGRLRLKMDEPTLEENQEFESYINLLNKK